MGYSKKSFFVVALSILMMLIGGFFIIMVTRGLLVKSVFFVGGLPLILLPFMSSKIMAKKSFTSNKMFQEEAVFKFIDGTIKTIGESFKFEMS